MANKSNANKDNMIKTISHLIPAEHIPKLKNLSLAEIKIIHEDALTIIRAKIRLINSIV